MITNSQRTIYGLEVNTANLAGKPYTPKPNTTLNEKYNILPNELPGADTNYSIKYLAIGIGGSNAGSAANGYNFSQHSSVDAALFDQIPFIMRPVANDLPASEQNKYRLKVGISINGVAYNQYFLRAIPSTDIVTGTYKISPVASANGKLISMDFNNSIYLSPTPLSNNRTYGSGSEYVTSTCKLRFHLTPTDINEINNCITLLHGTGITKNITEIGVCGGLDKTVNGILESIHTQIYFHIGVNIDLQLSYDPIIGFLRAVELGSTEPIYI